MEGERSNQPAGSEPRIGSPIFTTDGKQIGTVKELSGDSFKVDAPRRPDYWLVDCVLYNTEERVTVAFTSAQLATHRQKVPAGTGRSPGGWQTPPHPTGEEPGPPGISPGTGSAGGTRPV